MRKNQNGVSMVSLVITIIVMIILAAVAFGSSTETITNATFADFTNDLNEVQQFVQTKTTSVYGNLKAEGSNVNYAQVYNYTAKGGTLLEGESGEEAWIPMSVSTKLAATRILPEIAEEVFENKLPVITVNTANASKVPVSYFLTKEGKVFIWPPYLNESEKQYYITKDEVVKLISTSGDRFTGTFESGDLPVRSDDDTWVLAMFNNEVSFKVGNTTVYVRNNMAAPASPFAPTGLSIKNTTGLEKLPVVYYNDVPKAVEPQGLESGELSMYSTANDSL